MIIYPLKNNLLGKPVRYRGPYVLQKRDTIDGGKTLAIVELPELVQHVEPYSEKISMTRFAQVII